MTRSKITVKIYYAVQSETFKFTLRLNFFLSSGEQNTFFLCALLRHCTGEFYAGVMPGYSNASNKSCRRYGFDAMCNLANELLIECER